MEKTGASPFSAFLKFLFIAALIAGAFFMGNRVGYQRGFQETAAFTAAKLDITMETMDATQPVVPQFADKEAYNAALDAYIENSKSVDTSLKNIGESAENAINEFLNGLFGK